MNNLTAIILVLLLAFTTVSCKKDVIGEGPIISQARDISPFSAIDLRMNGNVYYKTDSIFKVEVSAKQSIMNTLETFVSNGRLVVQFRNGKTYDADESIRITVSAPAVNRFELNTSGSIYVNNNLQTGSLYLKTAGSGSIYLQSVNADYLEAEGTTSGKIHASGGAATQLKLKTSGSSSIDLSAVNARKVTAQTLGSGSIKVKVSDELNATIDGSGSIYFNGHPLLTTHINGTGDLIRF